MLHRLYIRVVGGLGLSAGSNVSDEIDDAVGVAVLVVVPGIKKLIYCQEPVCAFETFFSKYLSKDLPKLFSKRYRRHTLSRTVQVCSDPQTYQETSFTKFGLREMQAPASKMEECGSETKSVDTT